jgi:hypothetical protein
MIETDHACDGIDAHFGVCLFDSVLFSFHESRQRCLDIHIEENIETSNPGNNSRSSILDSLNKKKKTDF